MSNWPFVGAVETSVPPLAIGKTPVTPVVNGNPVALVNTPDAGVPSAGGTSVGDVANTTEPEPVELVSVGACPAEPVPVEVTNAGVVVVFAASIAVVPAADW